MRNKLFILLLFIFGYSVICNAQYFEDAYRFSRHNHGLGGSTARMQGIGGAQIALGGDISSAVSNPAGLGFFNKGIFVLTPSLDFTNADTKYGIMRNDGAEYQGLETTFKNNFNIANIGTVINYTKGRFTDDKFKGGSLAVFLNRKNSYHLNRTYEGENGFNSIVDNILTDAGTLKTNDLNGLGKAAFDQFLITPTTNGYDAFVGGFPVQRETIKERGSHYQMNIAWGGNYDDKIYFGGGMGIQFLNYTQEREYKESDFLQQGKDLDSLNTLTINNNLDVRGRGINFNFGTILRPVEFLTIGLSYTSPSFISFYEESYIDLEADWDAGKKLTETVDGKTNTYDLENIDPYKSNLVVSNYKLKTPSKIGVGIAVFVNKNGFITGDIEYMDYSSSSLNSKDFSTSNDNKIIKDTFGSVVNIRVGGEYRFESFRLRTGYAFLPDPIKNQNLQDRTSLTFGVGYRTFDYSLDLAVVSSKTQLEATSYSIQENQPFGRSELKRTTVSVTLGVNL